MPSAERKNGLSMPSTLPIFSWCLIDLCADSDEKGWATSGRSSFERSKFIVCEIMVVSPGTGRPLAARDSILGVDAEVDVEAARPLVEGLLIARGRTCGDHGGRTAERVQLSVSVIARGMHLGRK